VVGLEVNPEKTKYILMSRCHKAGQKRSVKITNGFHEDVEKFKYSGIAISLLGSTAQFRPWPPQGTTLADQNCVHEEIKDRINSGNACYYSLLLSRLLPRNVKVKICKTIIMTLVLKGVKLGSSH
jgi:hypothetical protein